jgi:signal transduction histidine kinase/ActR/RegA family two-component response regulator
VPTSGPDTRSRRILVLAPTGRDALLTRQLLRHAGLEAATCQDATRLFAECLLGVGAILVAEEALSPQAVRELAEMIAAQPAWSDVPVIVFSHGQSSDELLKALEALGNVTILERPVRVSTMTSAVRAALRARRRQYEVRDLLRQKEDNDRRKDEFLAVLGHELRNPLAAIRNAVAVLDHDVEPEVRAHHRRIIERQSDNLARMVDDLLDLSRVTLGKVILQRRRVDLRELVERSVHELGAATLARRGGLELEVDAQPLEVDGDPVRLEQVIFNLLHNALKYTPAGGHVSVDVRERDGQARLRVSDTGVGIPPEWLEAIFQPFAQVDFMRQRAQGGLGLGLPLIRHLVELHGGTVGAQSRGVGLGSEFTVCLPLAQPAAAAEESAAQPAAVAPAGTTRVLVVEDNADGRETLRVLLRILGHQVETAEDGHSGVEKAIAGHPEVALIDIGLPDIDGNEVARRVRQCLGDEPLLVAMTGYGQPEDRARAEAAGFDDFLVKPVDPEALARLLSADRGQRPKADDGLGAPPTTH